MAVRFDQNSDLISYSSSVFNPATDGFTMTAWTLVSVDQNTFQTMARLYAGSSTVATLSTRSDGTTGPTYYTVSGSIEGTGSFTVSEWRKVAWTCSGTNGKAYFSVPDGATQVFSGSVSSNSLVDGITLGGRAPNDLSEGLNGRLAYVRVWSDALSQAQIEAEWESVTPVRTTGLWADWVLADALDLTDHSGNGNHLSAGTTPVTTEDGPPISAAPSVTAFGQGFLLL